MAAYVVLVHGYLRQGFNMRYLARNLSGLGYVPLVPNLPTPFGNVATCSTRLASYLERRLPPDASPIHFVGHSMGGLIIRHYLSGHGVPGLGRVVLIATPNGGSAQSHCVTKPFPFLKWISPALADLAEPGMSIAPPVNDPPPEIGVIAGTDPRLFCATFPCSPGGKHDGRVRVESAHLPGATAGILLPFNHVRLHRNIETVRLVDRFLRTGTFEEREVAR